VIRSRMKLHSTREPYCCNAIDNATEASETGTLAAVIMESAVVLKGKRTSVWVA
jgi:hypothetical protein